VHRSHLAKKQGFASTPMVFTLAAIDITGGSNQPAFARPRRRMPRRRRRSIAVGGSSLFQPFVDCHTISTRGSTFGGRKPNPDGSFPVALTAVGEDRKARWTADDVERRMEFLARLRLCAWHQGAFAHIWIPVPPQEDISWPVSRLGQEALERPVRAFRRMSLLHR